MQRFTVVLAMLATVIALASPAAGAERWRPGLEAAREYAATRAGTISFAVRTRHRLYRQDAYRVYRSASVVKAMLLVAYLDHPSVRGRKLAAADRALLDPMIRRSDNVAASRVRDFVGNGGARAAGRPRRHGPVRERAELGRHPITAAGQSKLLLRIDRYVVRRHRAAAMRLLSKVDRRRSAGGSRGRRTPAGRSTSRAAGAAAARWTTRSRCCGAASAGSRWRS